VQVGFLLAAVQVDMLSEAQWEALEFWTEDAASSGVETEIVLSTVWSILRDQPKLIEHALSILDKDPKASVVKRFTDASNRHFYTVRGEEEEEENICFENFCSCPSFAQLSSGHEMKIMCKHLLATRIARALNSAEEINASPEQAGHIITSRGAQISNS
jgi:predicted nucleic acid-binding Zn finger protein